MTATLQQSASTAVYSSCPVAVTQLREIAASVAAWGVHSVSIRTATDEQQTLCAVTTPRQGVLDAIGPGMRASAPVRVRGTTVAIAEVVGNTTATILLDHAAEVVALRISDAWAASQELDSLSGEIVHAYEELHLLYELGNALSNQLTVAEAAEVILEHLLATFAAAWGQLKLASGQESFVRVDPRLLPHSIERGADDHRLNTTLRSNGQAIGELSLFRLPDDPNFSSSDIKLFEAVGAFAGNAIRTAQLFQAVRQQADTDALTGLMNHRAFQERLDVELAWASAEGYQLGVILIDIDNFKLFNDSYGHLVGDQILRLVAQALRETCRGQHDVVGRYGGDEFVAIVPHTDRQGLQKVAQRIVDAANDLEVKPTGQERLPLGLSIGCALFPDDAIVKHELIGQADVALYEVKRSGGNGIYGDTRSSEAIATAFGTSTVFDALQGLVNAVDGKDRYTRLHSEAVTDAALLLASQLGLSVELCSTLRVAGLLHDVGKIGIPDYILRKPGRLTSDEYDVMQQHVTLSELMIKGVPHLVDVLGAVASHHERYDGQGYPRGLRGEEIPLTGRIMAIADSCSAMLLDRPYRKGRAWEEVKAELRGGSGGQFDPALIEPFIQALEAGEYLQRLGLT